MSGIVNRPIELIIDWKKVINYYLINEHVLHSEPVPLRIVFLLRCGLEV